ncbi:KxYKxGKxW signal peptide domain-containing protein [uncultured Limosilactobacillus sp.]|uniref:KxYKxGKxW signal peptide domain-containing protein n=1 Tax=uncultured Limosilactobacillus sp. TaxID=2837629 RepID=UPI002587591E|nr:KxYKxGKxW signal peptide domain-containing protein [uncultured Limosilactobacillus sp.]
MENRNNALHYKMYKSGKSIVYAGLATTAAVAGLALANANNTASAATVNDQPTVEVANTSAAKTGNSDQIQSATAAVSAASDNVVKAQQAVSDAQAAVNSANNLNSDVAAVNKAQTAYSDALAKRAAANKNSVDAQSDFDQASANAEGAITTAANAQGFAANDQKAANKAVAYWNAISAETTSAQASVAAAKPQYDQKVSDAQENYNVQSAYVADLATQTNNLKSAASTAAANNASDADRLATAAANMEKKFNSAAYALNTDYAYKLNSAKADVQYFKNLEEKNTNTMNAVKDALTKISAFLTAKAANENAYQASVAAQAVVSQTEKAYLAAMDAHNLPNDKQLEKIETQAATDANWAKSYQHQLDATGYSAASDAVVNATSAQAALTSANAAVSEAQANYNANKTSANGAALASAQAVQASAEADALVYGTVKDAQDNLKNVLKQTVSVNEGTQTVQMPVSDLVAIVNQWNTKSAASTKKLNDVKANLAAVKDVQAAVDAANAKLATANANLTSAKQAYQDALDALNALKPGSGSDSSASSDSQGSSASSDSQGSSASSDSQGSNASSDSNASNATTSDAAKPAGSANGGSQQAAAATLSGNKAAAVAFAAKGNVAASASREASQSDSKALPQTGNENTAAVVALGAVSAMFGLGLAAKKREF